MIRSRNNTFGVLINTLYIVYYCLGNTFLYAVRSTKVVNRSNQMGLPAKKIVPLQSLQHKPLFNA